MRSDSLWWELMRLLTIYFNKVSSRWAKHWLVTIVRSACQTSYSLQAVSLSQRFESHSQVQYGDGRWNTGDAVPWRTTWVYPLCRMTTLQRWCRNYVFRLFWLIRRRSVWWVAMVEQAKKEKISIYQNDINRKSKVPVLGSAVLKHHPMSTGTEGGASMKSNNH